MEEYLKSHPLISTTGIEKALGLTHGLLRKGKPIPEKHRSRIAELLRSYGYEPAVNGAVPIFIPKEMPAEVAKQAAGRHYVVRRVYKLGIEDKHAYYIGELDNGIFRKNLDIQDNVRVTIG